MSYPQAFVYTELQVLRPFTDAVWRDANAGLLQQPGLINKTWLAGVANHSVGGFYAFDSIENARQFAVRVFPVRARAIGAAQTSRIFDGSATEDASRGVNSLHVGGIRSQIPGAFVYTELQLSMPFAQVPWRDVNAGLKNLPGMLHKTWLSGVGNQSIGGFYAFDTLENATRFVTDQFPTEAQGLGVAYTTRLYDATLVHAASVAMHSPFFV